MTSFANAVLPCLRVEGKIYGKISEEAINMLTVFDKRDATYQKVVPNDNFLDLLACHLLALKNRPGFTEKNRNAYMRIVVRRLSKYANEVFEKARAIKDREEEMAKASKMTTKDEENV